jgi:hypothetical protein
MNLMKKNEKITICNRMNLETPWHWPIMPKNFPGHCLGLRTCNPAWSVESQLPCSQRLKLHIMTSSELGPRTWEPTYIGLHIHSKVFSTLFQWTWKTGHYSSYRWTSYTVIGGDFFSTVGLDPTVSKTNWFHVDIFCVFFIKLGNILYISLNRPVIFLKAWIWSLSSETQPVHL